MMNIEIVDSAEKFRALEPVWNTVLAASDMDTPFMTFEWFWSWWSVYGKNNALHIVVIKDSDEIIAIAPLMRTNVKLMSFSVKAISFMDNCQAARTGLIVVKKYQEAVDTLMTYLRTSARSRNMIIFHALEKDGATARWIENALRSCRALWCEVVGENSPYIPIAGTWEEYFRQRSKNVRHKLNRISNMFSRRGGYEIVEYTDHDIPQAMEEVISVSRKSWKFKAHTSILDDEESVRFFAVLAQRMASRGWLTIWMLRLDGKPIAYQYALNYKSRVYGLKIDFDDEYRQMAPSKFLQRHIIQQCFSRQMKEFDLLGEKEAYKMDFTTSYRKHIKYMVFGNTLYGKALYALERHKMAVGRLLPQRKERAAEPIVS